MTDQQPPAVPPPYVPSAEQPGYVQPRLAPTGYAPPPPRSLSITSFALGLASIVFGFVFFIPIVGLVLGVLALKREPAGHGFAVAGVWLNAVMLGLVVLAILAIVLFVVVWSVFAIPFVTTNVGSAASALG